MLTLTARPSKSFQLLIRCVRASCSTNMSKTESQITEDLIRPLAGASMKFYLAVVILGGFVVAGFGAWSYQIYNGIGVAGINWPVAWGLYLVNFVFWIGISHAGTLISAILRLLNAPWRRPVTRCAEAITAFALIIGGMFPLIHLGRPWLFFYLIPYPNARGLWPNFRSALVWDFFAISTYITASTLFLYLPTIPDFALLRDRNTGLRRTIYGALSLGWRGTPKQWHRLESAMSIMAIAIIPIAVSVHTIVAFDFSMVVVPGWHSTIFGPYFVAGAIFSGIAALMIAMAVLRRTLHLEDYLQPLHFDKLGKLLLTMSLIWGYFTFNERLMVWYGNVSNEMAVLNALLTGEYAPYFWTMVVLNFVIPVSILSIKKLRTVSGTVVASVCVVVGMWLERYLIVVPSQSYQQLPYSWGTYSASWTEIIIMIASIAAMILLYVLFAKFVPIISIWEIKADYIGPNGPAGHSENAAPAVSGAPVGSGAPEIA